MLERGGVGIIPTDTMYSLVCDINNMKAVDSLYQIKNMNSNKPLSILCRDFADIDHYTRGIPMAVSAGAKNVFRLANDCLPGPYTLVLPASKNVPKRCFKKSNGKASCAMRREVGVRIPDDPVCQALLAMLPAPLMCTSVRMSEACREDSRDMEPAIMMDRYGPQGLSFVVDGGVRVAEVSTVVYLADGDPSIIRAGKGDPSVWLMPSSHDTDEESELRLKGVYLQAGGENHP